MQTVQKMVNNLARATLPELTYENIIKKQLKLFLILQVHATLKMMWLKSKIHTLQSITVENTYPTKHYSSNADAMIKDHGEA